MKKHLKTLRARHTVPHICKAFNISRDTWKNLSSGRTPLNQEQTAAIMRAVNTRFIIIDTEAGGVSCTARPYESFIEAAAAMSSEPGARYQIKAIYQGVK